MFLWPDVKVLGDKFFTQAAQIFCDFLAFCENLAFSSKTSVDTIWVTLWKVWTSFYSNIWSHCMGWTTMCCYSTIRTLIGTTHNGVHYSLGVHGHEVDDLARSCVLLSGGRYGQGFPVDCWYQGCLDPNTCRVHNVEVTGQHQCLDGAEMFKRV